MFQRLKYVTVFVSNVRLVCLDAATVTSNGRLSTIFGCATPRVKCAVSVIRISGPDALKAITDMTSFDIKSVKSRYAYVTQLRHVVDKGSILDEVIFLFFRAPRSYTGEDVVEFHSHGGVAVTDAILNSLSSIDSFRYAEPGEFTKRAVLNGKLTLRQAEGINNLVNAQTEKQIKSAVSQITTTPSISQGRLGGQSAEHFEKWRDQLINCQARIEAVLNFADEDGVIPDSQIQNVKSEVFNILTEIKNKLQKLKRSKLMKTGICVAIAGNPNVGKSSLMNILCSKHAALVSPFEGTTRDAIEVHVDFYGWPLTFVDTAGIRDTSDVIEKMGVEVSTKVIERADIIILVDSLEKRALNGKINHEDHSSIEPCGTRKINNVLEAIPYGTPILKVMNKMDLLGENSTDRLNFAHKLSEFICISCLSMDGIQSLLDNLKSTLEQNFLDLDDNVSLMSSELERNVLEKCIQQLEKISNENDEVMMAEYLKAALNEMSFAFGYVFTEDILDSVFKNFCIGK